MALQNLWNNVNATARRRNKRIEPHFTEHGQAKQICLNLHVYFGFVLLLFFFFGLRSWLRFPRCVYDGGRLSIVQAHYNTASWSRFWIQYEHDHFDCSHNASRHWSNTKAKPPEIMMTRRKAQWQYVLQNAIVDFLFIRKTLLSIMLVVGIVPVRLVYWPNSHRHITFHLTKGFSRVSFSFYLFFFVLTNVVNHYRYKFIWRSQKL